MFFGCEYCDAMFTDADLAKKHAAIHCVETMPHGHCTNCWNATDSEMHKKLCVPYREMKLRASMENVVTMELVKL